MLANQLTRFILKLEVQKMANVVAEGISVSGKTTKKTNVFWSTVPENEQFRNVRVPGVTSETIMSSQKSLKSQPQLLVSRSKSEPVVASKRDPLISGKDGKATRKVSERRKAPLGNSKGVLQMSLTESVASLPGGDSRRASLKNLNVEDKKRVANLIKELAKTGEERELALERLQEERVSFEERLTAVQEEQTALRLEKDVLQQKLKQGEIQLKKYETDLERIKQQKKNQDLVLKKRSAALAQGTQTSPLQKASSDCSTSPTHKASSKTSGVTNESISSLDVDRKFVPSSVLRNAKYTQENHTSSEVPQVPIYSNSLFDMKVSKAEEPAFQGPGDSRQDDAKEGSRLHELYLREYKLQLDLQEKQLEIQRQQVLLQQQLNLLQQQKQKQQPQHPIKQQSQFEQMDQNEWQTKNLDILQQKMSNQTDLNNNFSELHLTHEQNNRPSVQDNHHSNLSVNQGYHQNSQETKEMPRPQDQVIHESNIGYNTSHHQMSNKQNNGQPVVPKSQSYHSHSAEDLRYHQNGVQTDETQRQQNQSVYQRNLGDHTSQYGSSNEQNRAVWSQTSSYPPPHLAENQEYHDQNSQQWVMGEPHMVYDAPDVYSRSPSHHDHSGESQEYHQPSRYGQVVPHYNEHKNFKHGESQNNSVLPVHSNNPYRDFDQFRHGGNVPSDGYSAGYQRKTQPFGKSGEHSSTVSPESYKHDRLHLSHDQYHQDNLYHDSHVCTNKHHSPELHPQKQYQQTDNQGMYYPPLNTQPPYSQVAFHPPSRGSVKSTGDGSTQPINDHHSNTEIYSYTSEPYGRHNHPSYHNQSHVFEHHSHPEEYCLKCSGPHQVPLPKHDYQQLPTEHYGFDRQPNSSRSIYHNVPITQKHSNVPHHSPETNPDRFYQHNNVQPEHYQKRVGFHSVLVTDDHSQQKSRTDTMSGHSPSGNLGDKSLPWQHSESQVPLDRYISNHENSVEGRIIEKRVDKKKNNESKYYMDPVTSRKKFPSKVGGVRQLVSHQQRKNGDIRQGHASEGLNPGYSLYRPNASQRSPGIPQSLRNARQSPTVSRQMKPSGQSYPNSLIQFVDDLESTSEWIEPQETQERTFLSSDDEENSVLDNIFFLKR